MRTSEALWVSCLAAGVLFACSSTSSGTGSGDGGASASSSGSSSGGGMSSGSSSGSSSGTATAGMSLTANSTTAPATVNSLPPSSGSGFIVIDLTIKNTGASVPLSTDFVLFSLETSQSLVVSASPEQPTSQCSPTLSVASGGQLECQIAFQLPTGQTPATLLYDDLKGDKASAVVPAVPAATACQTVVSWTTKPLGACTECVGGALGLLGTPADGSVPACASDQAAYRSSCEMDGGACSSCSSNADACACELGCDSSSCQALFAKEDQCLVSACSAACE